MISGISSWVGGWKATNERIKNRWGRSQGGVEDMIAEATLGLVALNLAWSVWMLRIIVMEFQKGISQLDGMLGEAIQRVVEGGLGDFEAVNPIQKALADMLTNRITQGGPIDITRSEDGKFSSDSGVRPGS